MRKSIVAGLVALAVAGAGGGWFGYRYATRDPLAAARALMAGGDLRGALLELRGAVRRNPASAEAHLRLGAVQLAFGDAVAAEKELRAARAAGTSEAQVAPLLARSYLAQQRHVDLLRDFPATGLPPDAMAAVLVARSLAQVALRDGAAALASANAAERLAPTMAEAALATARVAEATGDHAQALSKVDRALRLDPRLIEALELKADILRAQGDMPQALAQLDAAVALLPEVPRLRLARARFLLAVGEDARARADVAAVLKADPRNTLGIYLRTTLDIRARDWASADTGMQKLQPVLSQLPRGDYDYALVKSNTGQLEQAADTAGHFTAQHPEDPDGWRLLADIDLKLAQSASPARAAELQAAAAASLRKAADLGGGAAAAPPPSADPAAGDTPETLTQLAALQLGAGAAAAAAHDLEESLQAAPRHVDRIATQVVAALAAGELAQAQAALDRLAAEPDAEPATLGNLTGLVRLARLDFDGARTVWQDTARAAPLAGPLHINLARVLALQGREPEAEDVLTGLLARRPGDRTALLALVEMQVAHGRVTDAIAAVQTARKSAPAQTGLLITEAALRARAGDFAGAYGVLDEVPLEQAHTAPLMTARAQILLAQGRPKDAADIDRQILLRTPEDAATRQRLIQVLVGLNQVPEALQLAREGLAQHPGNSVLLQTVAALTLRLPPPEGGLDAALALVDAALRDPINLPAARLLKGSLYMAAQRYDAAAAAYRAEMAEAPFAGLAVAEAGALRAAGHADEAAGVLRDWLASQPDPTVAQTLAVYDIEARRLDDAAAHLTGVLAARPSDAMALNNLAWVYQQQHDPRARALAEKAYLLQPGPQAADTLGWIVVQDKPGPAEAAKGLMLLRRAALLLKDDPTVQYHLSVALLANGLRDEAARTLADLLAKPAAFDERASAVALQQGLRK